jgi:hypothetical protein
MALIPRTEPVRWRASFVWSSEHGGPGLTVRRFRRTLQVKTVPDSFRVHVSADSRYVLWVNGQCVGRGPLKGTPEHYFFETYELAPYLKTGPNVIAAIVHWFGANTPTCEVHGPRAGFLLQGPDGAEVDTPGEWKVMVDRSITPDTAHYTYNAHRFLGYVEQVDAAAIPTGWQEADYDDSDWEASVASDPADIDRTHGVSPPRDMYPREIPALLEESSRFVRTIQNQREIPHLFGGEPQGWTVAPGEAGELILDAGAQTTGHPVFEMAGGAGRTVQVIYGECISHQEEKDGRRVWVKGIRDDFANGDVTGYRDTIALDGRPLSYEPFHWRTFWFIKIAVSAGQEPFTLRDASYRFTTYPQKLLATYESSDPDSERMFEISWRTLQLCSHETFEDCPYYEQLQYVGDTRLQALLSMALTGKTELTRRALRLFRDSMRPDGLVCSRVPSVHRQLIPHFALFWVLMVDDYWLWVGPREREFVSSMLPVVDGVLSFFRARLRSDGFVGPLPHWCMVDSAEGWPAGEPPAVMEGGSTYMTSLFICALEAAIRLHTQAGVPADAKRWRPLADRLRRSVRGDAWSADEGLFLERPDRADDTLSQHSQMMAILAEAATPEQTSITLRRLTTDPSLHRAKLMQSYYLARALEQAGAYDEFSTHVLEPWREMLAVNLSTWTEYWPPTRSDCHAWSAWIAFDFLTRVLGIRPGKPGFEEILIRPQTAGHRFARGSMPTPAGIISVDWTKHENGLVTLSAQTPQGVPVTVELSGCEPQRYASGGAIECSSMAP